MDRVASLVLSRADAGARVLVIAAAAIMVAVVASQVLLRYAFNSSFDWAEEASRLAFVSVIFLAIPLGIRDGTHVGIELVVTRFPADLRRLVGRITNLLAGGMMLTVAWTAVHVARATWSERLGAIDVTSSVFFFPVVVGALHSALHLLHMAAVPESPKP